MKSILRTHIIIALASIVLFLGSLLAFYLFASSMKAKERRVIEARDRLASFEQNKRLFASEAKALEEVKVRIESLESKVLTSESIPILLSSLEEKAAKRSIDFVLTTVESNQATETSPSLLHIDFSASGTLTNLEAYMKELLSQSYQVRFVNVSLYAKEGGTDAQGKAIIGGNQWQLLAGIDITSF